MLIYLPVCCTNIWQGSNATSQTDNRRDGRETEVSKIRNTAHNVNQRSLWQFTSLVCFSVSTGGNKNWRRCFTCCELECEGILRKQAVSVDLTTFGIVQRLTAGDDFLTSSNGVVHSHRSNIIFPYSRLCEHNFQENWNAVVLAANSLYFKNQAALGSVRQRVCLLLSDYFRL
jgi:hypothetical protein